MFKVPETRVITAPGAIFSAAITGADVALTNAQIVTFIIVSGTGTAAESTLKVMAKKGSAGTPAAVDFILEEIGGAKVVGGATDGQTITIGGAAAADLKAYKATITADMLAGFDYDTVYCTLTKVTSSTVPGSIVAITGQHKYAE